jgi:hypothetical protein
MKKDIFISDCHFDPDLTCQLTGLSGEKSYRIEFKDFSVANSFEMTTSRVSLI